MYGFWFQGKKYEIEIGHFVCDAPARAFLLNVKSHSGFYCCTKCTQKGEYFQRRITFPDTSAEQRSDQSFKNRTQPEHHTKMNPLILESVGVGLNGLKLSHMMMLKSLYMKILNFSLGMMKLLQNFLGLIPTTM